MGIRVVLADDHRIMREGLRSLLERQPDMEVVAEAEDGRTTVSLTEKLAPNVVIMDVAMPDLNGMEATRQITSRCQGVKVIALSMYSDRRFILGMLSAGASGYLPKDCAFEELIQAIRTVAANSTYLSPSVVNIVVKDYFHHMKSASSPDIQELTKREREVLQLLAEGKTVKEIGHNLHLSVKTVETHRNQIMHKLNLRTIADLTKYAVREGFTSLEK